jgi:ABC-type phosphate transport system substrate-binding protein
MALSMRLFKHIIAGTLTLGLGLSGARAMAADVVAVVSSKCATASLSKDQVADIFLGKTARFPDRSTATPIDQVEGSSARDEFYSKVTGKSAAQLRAHWSKIIFTGRGQPPKAVANGVEARKLLAQNPNAIGYIDRQLVDTSVKVVLQP